MSSLLTDLKAVRDVTSQEREEVAFTGTSERFGATLLLLHEQPRRPEQHVRREREQQRVRAERQLATTLAVHARLIDEVAALAEAQSRTIRSASDSGPAPRR